jgi:hypothetical protein
VLLELAHSILVAKEYYYPPRVVAELGLVDVVPTILDECKSPYGELSLASDEVACKVTGHECKSPYGELSLASDDVACKVTGHECKSPYGELSLASDEVACKVTGYERKSPYGEHSLTFQDIEHDCSCMSGTEQRQTRQCLEHSSTYSHLQEGVVKTCLERCSTLNYTERDSVRKCLIAHEALCDEDQKPLSDEKTECMFVTVTLSIYIIYIILFI